MRSWSIPARKLADWLDMLTNQEDDHKILWAFSLAVRGAKMQLEQITRPLTRLVVGVRLAERPPPVANATTKAAEDWLNAQKACGRLALVVPVLSFVLLLLPAKIDVNADVGFAKVTTLAGQREMLGIVIALMVAKIARDATRLLVGRSGTGLDIEFSEKFALSSAIQQHYVRPVDLVRTLDSGAPPALIATLSRIELARRIVLLLLASIAAGITVATLGALVWQMMVVPTLSGWISRVLAVHVAGLLLVALSDLVQAGAIAYREEHRKREERLETQRKLEAQRERAGRRPDPFGPRPRYQTLTLEDGPLDVRPPSPRKPEQDPTSHNS